MAAALQSPLGRYAANRALAMLGIWAALCFGGGLYASWLGYGGREFAATLTAFAFYFAVMLLFAAAGVREFLSARFATGGGYLLGLAVILGYLIYAFGTNTFAFSRAAAITALVFIPLALAASAEKPSARRVAGLCHDRRGVGGGEVFAFALAVALSRWAAGLRVHRIAVCQRGARDPSCWCGAWVEPVTPSVGAIAGASISLEAFWRSARLPFRLAR